MRGYRDLKCDSCGATFDNVFSDHTALPACSKCGGDTHASWHTKQAPGLETVMVFKPLRVDGVVFHNKKERDDYLAKATKRMARHGAGQIYIDTPTPAEHAREIDELKHEVYEKRLTGELPSVEQVAEVKAKKKERETAAKIAAA